MDDRNRTKWSPAVDSSVIESFPAVIKAGEVKILLVFLSFLVAAVAAEPKKNALPAEAEEALRNGSKFILFSIEPGLPEAAKPGDKPIEYHHGHKVLGNMELAVGASQAAAVQSVQEAIKNHNGVKARCFIPRHSLRVVAQSGRIYDFVICFECSGLEVYRGQKRIASLGITGSQQALDRLLKSAKVPLAKPPQS